MDLKQKYTEDNNVTYEIDDWFYTQLGNYSKHEQTFIIGQLLSVINLLPEENQWTQETAGVLKGRVPLFFVVEYLKEVDESPILVDLHEIEVDEYLEFISNKFSIKSYYDRRTEDADEEPSGISILKKNN